MARDHILDRGFSPHGREFSKRSGATRAGASGGFRSRLNSGLSSGGCKIMIRSVQRGCMSKRDEMLSMVVPVRNEQEVLADTYATLTATLEQLGMRFEVV